MALIENIKLWYNVSIKEILEVFGILIGYRKRSATKWDIKTTPPTCYNSKEFKVWTS